MYCMGPTAVSGSGASNFKNKSIKNKSVKYNLCSSCQCTIGVGDLLYQQESDELC